MRVAAAAQGRGGDSGLPRVPGDAGRCIDRTHTHLTAELAASPARLGTLHRPHAHTSYCRDSSQSCSPWQQGGVRSRTHGVDHEKLVTGQLFEAIEPALSPCAPAPCAPQEADSYTYQQVAAGFRGKPKTYL